MHATHTLFGTGHSSAASPARPLPRRCPHWQEGQSRFRHNIAVYRREIPAAGEAADPPFERLWKRFVEGDAEFRDDRLKYCFAFENAPFLVRSAITMVGAMRPVVMGRGYLTHHHFTGTNYVEVDVDIGSSVVANQIAGNVLGYSTGFIIKELFVLEGKADDELPERALCAHIVRHIDTEKEAVQLRAYDYLSEEQGQLLQVQQQQEAKTADGNANAATVECSAQGAVQQTEKDELEEFHSAEEDGDEQKAGP